MLRNRPTSKHSSSHGDVLRYCLRRVNSTLPIRGKNRRGATNKVSGLTRPGRPFGSGSMTRPVPLVKTGANIHKGLIRVDPRPIGNLTEEDAAAASIHSSASPRQNVSSSTREFSPLGRGREKWRCSGGREMPFEWCNSGPKTWERGT